MPGLVPGIHVLFVDLFKDVDGRDKPGHDGRGTSLPRCQYLIEARRDGLVAGEMRVAQAVVVIDAHG
jgi:hypothetical protein